MVFQYQMISHENIYTYNIVQTEKFILVICMYKNTKIHIHIYIYIHTIIINEKEAMNLIENRESYMGVLRRIGKGEIKIHIGEIFYNLSYYEMINYRKLIPRFSFQLEHNSCSAK